MGETISRWGIVAAARHGGWIWVLRAHSLSYKYELERELRVLQGWTPQSPPSVTLPCNPAQIAPPTGSQVPKMLETMEDISLKSPQEPSGSL